MRRRSSGVSARAGIGECVSPPNLLITNQGWAGLWMMTPSSRYRGSSELARRALWSTGPS